MSTIQKQQEDFASELFKKSNKEKNQEEVKRRMSPPKKHQDVSGRSMEFADLSQEGWRAEQIRVSLKSSDRNNFFSNIEAVQEEHQ